MDRSRKVSNSPSGEFHSKVALITGGARNIGFEIAREFASRGASIAIADICRNLDTIPYDMSSSHDLNQALAKLEHLGGEVMGLKCDVRNEHQVKSTIQKVVKSFGHLDILVNNAGVISLSTIETLSEEAWNEVLDICLKGTFFSCKHAIPHMIAQHSGRIINISSLAGQMGLGMSVHYVAAKHGVIGLTKSLAMEVANHNIYVNAVCPGTVESPMLTGIASQINLEGDAYKHFSRGHLMKKFKITPIDIAKAVCWLASETNRTITGTTINVDAGWSAAGMVSP